MEGREGGMSSSGVTVVGSDAPTEYHVAPRTEISSQLAGSAPPATATAAAAAAIPVVSPSSAEATATAAGKKKRGRPRKYGPDGSLARALSPKPISASPPVIDFSSGSLGKRGKVRGLGSGNKQQQPKYETENSGNWVACSVGANFTPHIITVNSGEDITMKVISFSQQGPRAICILSANGVISSVTLRQPDSSGGTLTYEGRFEILSLTGSFMPNDSGGTRSRSGGMSVSLASPDGRVVGGGVAGHLVAAASIQVVVGSFLAGNQHEQKPKKQKTESYSTATATAVVPIPGVEIEEHYGGQEHTGSATPRANFSSSSSFRGDNWSSLPSDLRNRQANVNITMPEA